MTEYVESFATQQMIPPWESLEVESWLFALELGGENGTLNFLDYLNGAHDEGLEPAPFVYTPRPGRQYAFLVVRDHPGAVSIARNPYLRFGSPTTGWNRMAFTQVSLMIPALRQTRASSRIGEEVWVQPFVWYDAASMVFSAREIWGGDAEYMRMKRETGPAAPRLHLDTAYVGVEIFSPGALNELLAALHLRIDDSARLDASPLPSLDRHLVHLIGQLVGVDERKGPVTSIEIDALKQFRSAENMALAIYRALVSSLQRHEAPRNAVFYDPARIEVDFMWSAGMAQLLLSFLGLEPPPGCGPLPPIYKGPDAPPPPPPGCGCGAPTGHSSVPPPPPAQPGDAPVVPRWNLPRLPANPVFCMSYTTDITFRVLPTRHVYRLQA